MMTEQTVPCLLCGGTTAHLLVTGYDRMEARAEDYRYVRCAGCGLVSLAPRPTPDEIPGFYPDDYYARINSSEWKLDKPVNRFAMRYFYGVDSVSRSRLLRALLRALSGRILNGIREPHGANRLLDVGCGSGQMLAVYRALGWRAVGIEISPRACAACRDKGLDVHEGTVFDAPLSTQQFDMILLSHVIEHVLDPVAVLKRVADLLAPGGKIILTTPNVRGIGFSLYGSCWHALDAPRHVFLFDPQTLHRLGEKAGLVTRQLRTQPSPTMLCESRHYAATQGAQLPNGMERRRAILGDSARRKRPGKLYRELIAPVTFLAALWERGDVLEAEFAAAGGG
jgi:SAM-dependent methyltransferase